MNWLGRLATAGVVVLVGVPVNAQMCTSLRAVGGPGTQIQKTISPPGAGVVVRNNWNTDFAVPSTQSFSRYVAKVLPKNNGEYRVQMSLKYNDGSVDKVYDQTVKLQRGRSLTISGSPRINANPFQVNMFVGGIPVVGSVYTVSVTGCN